MERIKSFTINHDKLKPGFYISREDGEIVTYDLRTRKPNSGSLMDNAAMHSVEHLFATYARNSAISANVVYFGPMGCQTGFYFVVQKETPERVYEMTLAILRQILAHDGAMPGGTRKECGNYQNLSLAAAKAECEAYLQILEKKERNFRYEE